MFATVLLDDSEPARHGVIERELRQHGFELAVPGRRPDVVVAGDRIAAERWRGEAPVILLGGRGTPNGERVAAYRIGCSEYVPEPFDHRVLLERIRVVLGRARPESDARLVAGPLEIDLRTRLALVHGVPLRLAQMEFALLAHLAADPERVFSRTELLRDVWDYRSAVRTRTLDAHICRLRRKLREAGAGESLIENHWGFGYRLLAAFG